LRDSACRSGGATRGAAAEWGARPRTYAGAEHIRSNPRGKAAQDGTPPSLGVSASGGERTRRHTTPVHTGAGVPCPARHGCSPSRCNPLSPQRGERRLGNRRGCAPRWMRHCWASWRRAARWGWRGGCPTSCVCTGFPRCSRTCMPSPCRAALRTPRRAARRPASASPVSRIAGASRRERARGYEGGPGGKGSLLTEAATRTVGEVSSIPGQRVDL